MIQKFYKYHLFYKTIRPTTNEYYYGIHSTNNIHDGYQGSGTRVLSLLKNNEFLITGIVDYCVTREDALIMESEIVDAVMLADPLCLNLTLGGRGNKVVYGLTIGDKQAISDRMKGNQHNTGNKHSHETLKKMSECKIGKKLTQSTKDKLSTINTGKTHTILTKTKIGLKHSGKVTSQTTKDKMSVASSIGTYITPLGSFHSLRIAADAHGVTPMCIKKRTTSTTNKFTGYTFIPK